MPLSTEQQNALLLATLKEVLRIAAGAEVIAGCIPIDSALAGSPKLLNDWKSIRARAKQLIATCTG